MTEAFALFATDCISLTPSGSLEHEKHEAVARTLKHAIPDGHMEMIHTLRSGGEIFVTGRLWEPTETISPLPKQFRRKRTVLAARGRLRAQAWSAWDAT